jgi:DNA-binding response OmpR family regulator
MIIVSQKDLLLSQMQELDTALQMMMKARSEMYSILAGLSDGKNPEEIGIPLTFYENGQIISWGDDSEHFTPQTFRLLLQLWLAPSHTLSKVDVCEDVIEDSEAKDGAIWTCLNRARQELKAVDFPYEIETLHGKGYRLRDVRSLTDLC